MSSYCYWNAWSNTRAPTHEQTQLEKFETFCFGRMRSNAKSNRYKRMVRSPDIHHGFSIFFFFSKCDDFKEMRSDIQEIFEKTPHDKQVMMFSATLSKEMRSLCKKFMQDVKNLF